MIEYFRPIWATTRVQMIHTISRPVFRFVAFIQPLVFVAITYFMFAATGGKAEFLVFVIVGSGMAGLWSSLIFSSAGDIERERAMGTLEGLFVAPVSFRLVMLGKVIGNSLLGMLSLFLSFLYARILFGVRLSVHPGVLTLGLLLVLTACMTTSLVMAPLFTLSRSSHALMNGLEYPLFILSGVLFPVEYLPGWLSWASNLLPPTWAMRVLRKAFSPGIAVRDVIPDVAWLFTVILGYLLAMGFLYQSMERRVRITGTLGVD